jgi:C4-dicarboxylate transporter DctM subunit
LAAGVPVSFSLGFLSVIGILFLVGPKAFPMIGMQALNFSTRFEMACIAEFVFMAEIIRHSGVAERAFDGISKWVNWLPGGLANGVIAFCAVFAAITGSSAGNALTAGLLFIPDMLKHGYNKHLSLGTVAGGGTLGILIPPSVGMILYSVITQESLGHLFIAGIIPGILLAGLFILFVIIWAIVNPEIAPREAGVSWKERLSSVPKFLPTLALILVVLGGIYAGICTPSEAAALGAAGSVIIGLAYRELDWGKLRSALLQTSSTFGFLLLLIISGICFGFVLTTLRVPQQLTETIVSLRLSPWVVIIIINLFLLFLGCFLDPGSMVILTVPIIYPLILSLGFDGIWFGVILVINMELANITPPVGLNLYVIKGIVPKGISFGHIVRGTIPFMALLAVGMIMVMVFPQLALWLPSTMR